MRNLWTAYLTTLAVAFALVAATSDLRTAISALIGWLIGSLIIWGAMYLLWRQS